MLTPSNYNNRVANLELQTPHELVRSHNPTDGRLSDHIKQSSKDQSDRQSQTPADTQVSSRQEQHFLLYILNLLLTFCISFQNIPLVFTRYMSITILIVTICISLITTYKLCQDKWKIFNLYLLLDNIFLAQVASSFGFVGFLLVIYNQYWYQMITMMAFPIQILFFVGNFRMMMLTVKWSKWKVILFKLVLLADSAVFFQIGAYYMSVNYLYTNGSDSQLDGKVKDFVLLYIFGLFALFVEMYVKVCEIDQTNQLRFDYQLKQMEELKRIQKIRKSVIGLNLQEIQRSQMFIGGKKQSKMLYLQVEDIIK